MKLCHVQQLAIPSVWGCKAGQLREQMALFGEQLFLFTSARAVGSLSRLGLPMAR